MPEPQWEGVANQIADSLRKAGGESLYEAVYEGKVKNGKAVLTEIHHRQTPMRIMSGQLDAGVTWASEVRFQRSINNPIEGVVIPANQNTTAIYAGGVLRNASHPELAAQWLEFLKSREAQESITSLALVRYRVRTAKRGRYVYHARQERFSSSSGTARSGPYKPHFRSRACPMLSNVSR